MTPLAVTTQRVAQHQLRVDDSATVRSDGYSRRIPIIDGQKWICDVPGCGRLATDAATVEHSWRTIAGPGGEMLLCDRCVAERDAGLLADYRECAECKRDWRSGEDEWHTVPDERGLSVTYCGDCWASRNDPTL